MFQARGQGGMTFLQMKYFVTVCECKNVTQAAEKLHVSQPSVSHAIRELEEEYQITLFRRVHKKMVLTEDGRFVWEKANEILAKCYELEAELKQMGKKELNIGVPPMIGSILFSQIFPDFHEKNPDIKVNITEKGSLMIKEMVQKGELEAALIIRDAGENTELCCHRILRTKLKYCVSPKHKFGNKARISMQELDGEEMIGLKEDSFLPGYLEAVFSSYGIKPEIVLEASQIYVIRSILEKGKAGAFLLEEIVDREDGLKGIELNEPIPVDICLIWRKDSMTRKEMKRFVAYVKKAFAGEKQRESGGSV